MDYKLIAVEGNIGSGKTSFAQKLAAKYRAHLVLETFADNPFLQKFFITQKDYALGTEMFFMAERYEQFKAQIETQLQSTQPIVIDYLFTKSLIFAESNLGETEFLLFKKIFNILNPKLPNPDVVLYLHSDPERLMANIIKRGREFELTVKQEYLKKIESAYFRHFENLHESVILIADVTGVDFVTNNSHFEMITQLIENKHEPGLFHYLIK